MAHAAWSQEFILMALLVERPDHGYGLFRRLQDDPGWGRIWTIQRSELYFLLRKLTARGWARPLLEEKAGGPTRSKVGPTPLGRRRLMEWIRTPVSSPRDLRTAFVAKLYLAMQRGPRFARTLLDRQRQVLRRRLRKEGATHHVDPVTAVLGVRSAQTLAVLAYLDKLETTWLPRTGRTKPARVSRAG